MCIRDSYCSMPLRCAGCNKRSTGRQGSVSAVWKVLLLPLPSRQTGPVSYTHLVQPAGGRYFFLHQNPCNAGGSTPVYSKVKNLLYNPACFRVDQKMPFFVRVFYIAQRCIGSIAVSYTHLDVYKRQHMYWAKGKQLLTLPYPIRMVRKRYSKFIPTQKP